MSTTLEQLDQEIVGAGADWPILAYDDQVTTGTMMLFDFNNPATWPTGAIVAAAKAGDVFQNLAEDNPDTTVEAAGALPTFETNGLLFGAAPASLLLPAGFGDLAALGWPPFHMTVWLRTPAAPAVAASKCAFGYGQLTNSLQYGVMGAYSSGGTTFGVVPRYAGAVVGSAVQVPLGSQVCASITAVDASNGARRVRTYVNNVQNIDMTITPAVAAAPTQQARIGKGSSAFAAWDGRIQRVNVEHCGLSGRDPEVARAAEWAAKRAAFGL